MSARLLDHRLPPIERGELVTRGAVGTFAIKSDNPDRIVAAAREYMFIDESGRVRLVSSPKASLLALLPKIDPVEWRDGGLLLLRHDNAYVNTGLNNSLDREFGLGGTAVGFIGVSSNTTVVTPSTVNLNGASGGAAANTIIKALSPAATRSAQTVTGGATFANADFTAGVFVWNKIGYLTTSTDAGTGLVDVIGGTGGSSPYNRTFVIDLTAAGAFSVIANLAVTAQAA